MTSGPDETQRQRDLALLRRVRDRTDREYAQPLDAEALVRGVHMSAGHLHFDHWLRSVAIIFAAIFVTMTQRASGFRPR